MKAGRHRVDEVRTPGPRGLAVVLSALAMKRDPFRFVLTAMRRYGDVVRIPAPGRTIFLLASPAAARHVLCDHDANFRKGIGLEDARPLMGEGLLTGDGAAWVQSRRHVQPLFNHDRRRPFEAAVVSAALTTATRWTALAHDGVPVDVVDEMDRLTLNVAGQVFLRTDLDPIAGSVSRQFATLSSCAIGRATALCPIPSWLPTIGSARAARARAALSRMLDASCTAADPGTSREELATLLLAGYDTSAATLSWTWHLLAQHHDVRARIERELDDLSDSPSPDEVEGLTYLRLVVDEVLRLFPPVWILPRRSIVRDCIAGHDVPAGADVLVCIAALHRNPTYWPEPDRFDPSRFLPARASAQRHPFAYLPFGAGPRACIGSRYGTMEVLLALSVLARKFRLNPVEAPLRQPVAGLTLRPRRPLRMRIQSRRAGVADTRRFTHEARACV